MEETTSRDLGREVGRTGLEKADLLQKMSGWSPYPSGGQRKSVNFNLGSKMVQ